MTNPNQQSLAPTSNPSEVALSGAQWTERYRGVLLDTFGPPQRVLVRGEGCYVWDADGKQYLDLLAGIAVNVLGHAHPTLTAALSAQLGTLGHISNFFASPAQIRLAERLLEISGAPQGSRVFFTNSGTEANEAAFKLARRTGRPRIIALENAFHGRTMGALALTHKAAYREPFAPLPAGVEFVPAGDISALAQAMGPDVAAVFIEPIQGEAGVQPFPAGYLAQVRELTLKHGSLLILDEVQTGMGRTGKWLAVQHTEVGQHIVPDAVTLAKGLGGGIPVGALITMGPHTANLLGRGQHGTTFGGNPIAAAAALATIGVIERDGLLDNATRVGDHMARKITDLAHPLIHSVRGYGLLLAVQFHAEIAAQVVQHALAAGFIINAVRPDAIRLAPPLILTTAQADTFINFLAALPADLTGAKDPS